MKKITFIIIATLITFAAYFTACVEEPNGDKFPTDKYFYDIPDVPVTENYVVGTFYHELTERYWFRVIANQVMKNMPEGYTGTPLLPSLLGLDTVGRNGGYFMNEDYTWGGEPWGTKGTPGKILQQQLAWGKQAGIDFFLISWNGKGTDTLLFNFKNTWKEGDPKAVVIFDCGHLYRRTADSLHISTPPNFTKAVLLRQIDSLKMFFDEPYYYKLNGTTPLFGFDNYKRTNSVAGTVDEVREHLGGNVYLISPTIERGNGYTSPEFLVDIRNRFSSKDVYIFREDGRKDGKVQMPFDAIYQPAMLTDNYNRYGYDNWRRNFFSLIDYNYGYWKQTLKSDYNIEYIPSVMPAFDNFKNDSTSNILRLPGTEIRLLQREESGELYKTYANVGKRNAGKNRIVLINSWNNFKQGTNLEPTVEFGDAYLNFTRKYFKKD